jgi:protein-disulfide isomerase
MAAMRPNVQGRPSRRSVVVAFAVAIAAAVALVVVGLVFRNTGEAPDPISTPVVALAGIPQENRVLGEPTANVTLIEYADAQCPGCRFYSVAIFPTIVNEYIRPGKVKTEYRGYPFIGSDSVKALRFVLAAGLQDHLWDVQEALYRYQGAENRGWVTDDLVRELAAKIDGLDVEKLFADAQSQRIEQEAEQAEGEAQATGIPGTPAFFIKIGNEQPYYVQLALDPADFRAALDDALQG